jgi:predicted GIY-YIG superfamily endonuclease
MKYFIYAIRNKVNSKLYVGSTKSFTRRRYSHTSDLKNNKHHSLHLQNSYNKYTKDNFEFIILEEGNATTLERKQREIYYISLHKTSNRKFGYNYFKPNEENFACAVETIQKLKKSEYVLANRKSIDIYDLQGNFLQTSDSINDAAKAFNFAVNIFTEILNGKRKSFKGVTCVIHNEPFTYTPSKMQRNMQSYHK